MQNGLPGSLCVRGSLFPPENVLLWKEARTMRVIGLTGGIACGKSNVSAALRDLGAAVVVGDLLSRELTAPGDGPGCQR